MRTQKASTKPSSMSGLANRPLTGRAIAVRSRFGTCFRKGERPPRRGRRTYTTPPERLGPLFVFVQLVSRIDVAKGGFLVVELNLGDLQCFVPAVNLAPPGLKKLRQVRQHLTPTQTEHGVR